MNRAIENDALMRSLCCSGEKAVKSFVLSKKFPIVTRVQHMGGASFFGEAGCCSCLVFPCLAIESKLTLDFILVVSRMAN